jgi:hypothetical protein
MESVTYHLYAEEIDQKLHKSIKARFKGRITLTITPDTAEKTRLGIEGIIDLEEKAGYTYKFSSEEFNQLAADFEKNPEMDINVVFEAHKVYHK